MRMKSAVNFAAVVAAMSLTLAACSGAPAPAAPSGGASSPSASAQTVIDRFGSVTETVGPNGEKPTKASALSLSDEQKQKLASGKYRAAILWHELSAWTKAIQAGIESELDELGIDVVTTGDAKFDAATQANQIQSAIALKPDVILGQAVDPTTGAAAYQPAVDAGVKLIYADQAPDGYVYGKQYQAILTDDLFQIGQRAGTAMCQALGNKGQIAVVYYDAEFHVTNFRDAAFLSTIAKTCPEVEVVAKQGFTDSNKAEEIGNALLTKYPNLAGVYVSWAVPAQGILAALKNAGNTATKIVTVDLDDTAAADMAAGGNVTAIVADEAYQYGRAMGVAAALAILGEPGPSFGISDSVTVTKDSLEQGYQAWNEKVPDSVQAALKR